MQGSNPLEHVPNMHKLMMANEWASERVVVLMTPTEKTVYTEKASSMGLSLGQFFREAGAAYVKQSSQQVAEAEALQAVLTQLELSICRAERALGSALAEVFASHGNSA
jgi:hypothetical protein